MSAGRPSDERTRAAYDTVAAAYDAALRDELDQKPLDRGLLAAVAELAGAGRLLDLGCGPGHVTAYLARHHRDVLGIDLSPEMVAIARRRHPELSFEVGSMLGLELDGGAVAGIVALYSVIHLDAAERAAALGEMARVLAPGGWLLLAFHIESEDHPPGDVAHLTSWFGHDVDIEGRFIHPDVVRAEILSSGLEVTAEMVRAPGPGGEYPSRRCYLLARAGP